MATECNGYNKDEHKLPQITIHFSSDNKNTDMNLCQTQTLLKVLSVNDPYGGILFGHHCGSTWHQVQQGQLTKAATRCNCLHQFPSLLLQKTGENLGWNWNCLIFKWGIAQINTQKITCWIVSWSKLCQSSNYLYTYIRLSDSCNFQDRIWMHVVIGPGRFSMQWSIGQNIHE